MRVFPGMGSPAGRALHGSLPFDLQTGRCETGEAPGSEGCGLTLRSLGLRHEGGVSLLLLVGPEDGV